MNLNKILSFFSQLTIIIRQKIINRFINKPNCYERGNSLFLCSVFLISCSKYKGKWKLAGTSCESCGTSWIYVNDKGVITNGEAPSSSLYFKGTWKESIQGIEVNNSNNKEYKGLWEYREVDRFNGENFVSLISPSGSAFRKD